MRTDVIGIFDVGKTNKKFILYNEKLEPVYKVTAALPQTADEDLFPCEDHVLLKDWMLSVFAEAVHLSKYRIKALNFSAYGATLVHLDNDLQPVAPIYNYLKPYVENLQKQLYTKYGGRSAFCSETASPPLGHLNSGLTLYWIKQHKPELYEQIRTSLHLPEFCSFLFSDGLHSSITSIGCHTHLWDFSSHQYHRWVQEEGLVSKLAPLCQPQLVYKKTFNGTNLIVGTGLHDSSSALIPHLKSETEPFVLLSTGTWCITLNPFNHEPLSIAELEADCLCYLSYNGTPVKAARYFAGKIHEDMVKGLCEVYEKPADYFFRLEFDEGLFLIAEESYDLHETISYYNLPGAAEAYHHFMYALVRRLLPSVKLAIGETRISRLIVEGGFCRNRIFMTLLERFLPDVQLLTSGDEEASALGAAMLMQDVMQQRKAVTL